MVRLLLLKISALLVVLHVVFVARVSAGRDITANANAVNSEDKYLFASIAEGLQSCSSGPNCIGNTRDKNCCKVAPSKYKKENQKPMIADQNWSWGYGKIPTGGHISSHVETARPKSHIK